MDQYDTAGPTVTVVVEGGIIQDVEYPEPVDQHQDLAEYLWNLGIALARVSRSSGPT